MSRENIEREVRLHVFGSNLMELISKVLRVERVERISGKNVFMMGTLRFSIKFSDPEIGELITEEIAEDEFDIIPFKEVASRILYEITREICIDAFEQKADEDDNNS